MKVSPQERKSILEFVIVLGLYLLTYLALSLCGGYRFMASDQSRPTGLAMADAWLWQPYLGEFRSFRTSIGEHEHRGDFTGCLFAPMIALDQKFWHRVPASAGGHVNPAWDGWRPDTAELHPFTKQVWQVADRFEEKERQARLRGDKTATNALSDKMFAELMAIGKRRWITGITFLIVWFLVVSWLAPAIVRHGETRSTSIKRLITGSESQG